MNYCTGTSTPDSAAVAPDLEVAYGKNFYYIDNSDWNATYKLSTPLNLTNATRFTCYFQTDALYGYYSGKWYLVLTDSSGNSATYMICKEAWLARQPIFVEQALTGWPSNVNIADIVQIELLGYSSSDAQNSHVWLTNLEI